MRAHRNAILCIAAVATLILAAADAAFAQRAFSRGPSSNISAGGPSRGGSGYYGGGYSGGGWGGPGVLLAIPQMVPPGGQYIDDGDDVTQGAGRPPQRSTRRGPSGAPAANERRLVADEVVIEVANSVSSQQIDALQRRYRLTRIESQTFQLSGTTLFRWRIPDRRSVAAVVRVLEADRVVASAQPNYLFTLQQVEGKAVAEGDAAQYELAKLRLPQAHGLAKGDKVLVAVIDSGVDANHPELAGAVAETYDTLTAPMTPHKHGTAIAGLIAAHGKLDGRGAGRAYPGDTRFRWHGRQRRRHHLQHSQRPRLGGGAWRARHQYEFCRAARSRAPSQPEGRSQEGDRSRRRGRKCRAEIAAALSRRRSERDRADRDRCRRQAVRAGQSRPPHRGGGAGRANPGRYPRWRL